MNRLLYRNEIFNMANALDEPDRRQFFDELAMVEKNPVALYGWNIWLGFLGVDRFIVGDVVLGVLKLITLGGLGIWQIVDCFLIGNRARTKNLLHAYEIHTHISGMPPAEPLV